MGVIYANKVIYLFIIIIIDIHFLNVKIPRQSVNGK